MLQKKNADFLVPRKSASLGREEFSLQIGGINRAFFQRDGARRAKSGAERQKGNPERTLLALAEARLGTGLLELLQATMSHYAKTPLMKPVLDEFETCFDQKKGKTKEQVRLLITVFGDERVSKQLLELCRKKETAPLAKGRRISGQQYRLTRGVFRGLRFLAWVFSERRAVTARDSTGGGGAAR